MGAVGFLVGLATLGTGTQVAGQIMGASAQADAAEKSAAMKYLQADELLARQEINEGIMREQGRRSGLAYASRNSIGEGAGSSGVGAILAVKQSVEDNINMSRREAEFQAKMLRAGADIDMDLASDMMTAGWLGAGSSLAYGAGKAYNIFKTGSAKELYEG